MLKLFKTITDHTSKLLKNLHANALPTLTMLICGFALSKKPIIGEIAEKLGFLKPVDYMSNRVWRFLSQSCFKIEDVCADIAEHFLLRLSDPRVKFVTVALDWTKVKAFDVLTAAIPIRGRCQPIFLKVWLADEISGFMSELEKQLVEQLLGVLPKKLRSKVVFVADRGFMKPELWGHIESLGACYAIRIPRGRFVKLEGSWILVENIPVDEGTIKFYPKATITKEAAHNCAFLTMRLHHWEMKHKDDGLLMFASNLEDHQQIITSYKKRPQIEAMFKDFKKRGLRLNEMLIRTVESARKMLLVVFLYYLIVVVLALTAVSEEFLRRIARHGSRSRLSVFRTGDALLQSLLLDPDPQSLGFLRTAWCR